MRRPLDSAVFERDIPCVEVLLDFGAPVDYTTWKIVRDHYDVFVTRMFMERGLPVYTDTLLEKLFLKLVKKVQEERKAEGLPELQVDWRYRNEKTWD